VRAWTAALAGRSKFLLTTSARQVRKKSHIKYKQILALTCNGKNCKWRESTPKTKNYLSVPSAAVGITLPASRLIVTEFAGKLASPAKRRKLKRQFVSMVVRFRSAVPVGVRRSANIIKYVLVALNAAAEVYVAMAVRWAKPVKTAPPVNVSAILGRV
jgi:hypothetical protein